MVKIIDESIEERATHDKHKNLVQVTHELIGRENFTDMPNMAIHIYGEKVSVKVRTNEVTVYDSDRLDEALRLAEAYEKKTGEEFTLVKRFY